MRIAVVGAGLSGLVVAERLQSIGTVQVFDKSRGAGGRMSTRYAGDYEFDHGAQYFTARSDAFRAFLEPLIDDGTVREWPATIAEYDAASLVSTPSEHASPLWVGAPRMNSIGKVLARRVNVSLDTPIASATRGDAGWTLTSASGETFGPYELLIYATPAPQTQALASASPELMAFCDSRSMVGCFALMLGLSDALKVPWQAARVSESPVSWLSINSSKPGRHESSAALVVHSANDWADEHIEDNPQDVEALLLEEASAIVGTDLGSAPHRQLHRWRYANAAKRESDPYYVDLNVGLAACGDWCIRGRVEEAFTSASLLADELERQL